MEPKSMNELTKSLDIQKLIALTISIEKLNNSVLSGKELSFKEKCKEVINISDYFFGEPYDKDNIVIDRDIFEKFISGVSHTMMALGSRDETERMNHAEAAQRRLARTLRNLRAREHE